MIRLPLIAFLISLCLPLFVGWQATAHDDHDPPLLGAIYPQIAPDGKSVVVAHQGAIWRISLSDGAMLRLTSADGFDNWPAWSPDAARIAFINGRGSHVGPIQIIEAADGTPIELSKPPIAKDKLLFAPDGERLLSLFHKEGGGFALRWFNVETGMLGEKLYADVRGLRYSLSQDGNRIAFSTTQDIPEEQGGNNGPQCDLWIMPSSGGEARKLTQFPGRVYELTWNSDGRSLFVVSNIGGVHNDLWHVPIDDPLRGATKLTHGQADEDAPSVDSNGERLVFTDNRRGPTALVMRNLHSSRDSVVTVSHRDFGSPTGRLSIEIRDADSGDPITARVSVRHERGKYHAPPDAIYRMLRSDIHFYCDGAASFDVPAGMYSLKVSRGPEYEVLRREVTVPAGKAVDEELRLRRWTNQKARNWYSGESHIHANYGYGHWYNSPRTMLAQSAGEDLIVSNFMVANSEADGVFDREFFRGSPDPLSNENTILYWNQEFRSTIWGHLTLLNLKRLVEPIFTGFARTTHPHDHPTNADIADHVHDQDGHVNYTHPAHNVRDPYLSAYSAKALPLDVALGKVDSIDVMGSNHEANMDLWYRLLNCGFRIPASAGTDCFLNRVRSRLPGQVRVYVHVEDEFSYQRWVDSLQAGQTFVTDGPMFDFTVNRQLAGSTVSMSGPGTVKVQGRIRSQYPVNRVEIVSGGKVAHKAIVDQPGNDVVVDIDLPVKQSGWIAMRAAGRAHPDQPTGNVFGHTSPVYVEVDGQPIDGAADAAYFVKWIDRLHTDLRRRNRIPRRHLQHVELQIAEARGVFTRLTGAED